MTELEIKTPELEIPTPESIIQENSELQQQIYRLESQIRNHQQQIKDNEKKIWKYCTHEWEKDWEGSANDRSSYFCSKCKLWRNEYMYR